MITGLHLFLTYSCNFECDHCFVYSSPRARGTFTFSQIEKVLQEAKKIDSLEIIYFEGGEPFLYYPLMLRSARLAAEMGFKIGIVTNGYFAVSAADAEIWLEPLQELEIVDLSISNDSLHYGEESDNPATRALEAAKKLKIPAEVIEIEEPVITEETGSEENQKVKGAPVIGGSTLLRGRAVEKFAADLPQKDWKVFKECPAEELENPGRVHLDSYGNVHICQGLSIGNMTEEPLAEILLNYQARNHPICRPLIEGGPAQLAREYGLEPRQSYADACHFCYLLRRDLLEKFPRYLAPEQVYGLGD